jgi:hypothetical protein
VDPVVEEDPEEGPEADDVQFPKIVAAGIEQSAPWKEGIKLGLGFPG